MKRLLSVFSIIMVLLCTVVSAAGCSCASTVNVGYKVYAQKNNSSNPMTESLRVRMTLDKKFREPLGTPCYRKLEKEFEKILYTTELQECYGSNHCYKKVGKEYVPITSAFDVTKCETDKDCYMKVDNYPSYKLIIDDEGVAECYTATGEYFERATYAAAEKVRVDERNLLQTSNNKMSNESLSSVKVPKEEQYSLIYNFYIKNEGSSTVSIKCLDVSDIMNGTLKEESYKKVKLTAPAPTSFKDNKYYFALSAGSEVAITIEIKHLLTSDLNVKDNKAITLNIPVQVR